MNTIWQIKSSNARPEPRLHLWRIWALSLACVLLVILFTFPGLFSYTFGGSIHKELLDTGSAMLTRAHTRRSLPAHLRAWHRFAKQHRCLTHDGYQRIARDLGPFRPLVLRDASWLREPSFCLAHKDTAYCSIVSGTVNCTYANSHPRDFEAHDGMRLYLPLLPDFSFCVNLEDWPQMPAPDASVDTQNLQHDDRLLQECQAGPPANPLIPLFSLHKIDGCHRDIVMPLRYQRVPEDIEKLSRSGKLPFQRWEEKEDKVAWAGSSTGTFIKDGVRWWNSHRFRLVERFSQPDAFGRGVQSDIHFSGIVQCAMGEMCSRLCSNYTCAPPTPMTDFFKAKFIIDVDGNGQSERFEKLLVSGSVILKATAFSGWWKDRLQPWVHFVPVRMDFGDLNQTVRWLHEHDDVARRIGEASRRMAQRYMRNIDQDCFVFRLLAEYHAMVYGD